MKSSNSWFCYWLHSDHGTDPRRHGYVGVTSSIIRRIWFHSHRDFPAFKVKILLKGSHEECYSLEKKLRPTKGIGWNKRAGGPTFIRSKSGQGRSKSSEHKEKIRQATIRRYADPAEHLKTSWAVKLGLPKDHGQGEKNSMFGRKQSEETKRKISETKRLQSVAGAAGESASAPPDESPSTPA